MISLNNLSSYESVAYPPSALVFLSKDPSRLLNLSVTHSLDLLGVKSNLDARIFQFHKKRHSRYAHAENNVRPLIGIYNSTDYLAINYAVLAQLTDSSTYQYTYTALHCIAADLVVAFLMPFPSLVYDKDSRAIKLAVEKVKKDYPYMTSDPKRMRFLLQNKSELIGWMRKLAESLTPEQELNYCARLDRVYPKRANLLRLGGPGYVRACLLEFINMLEV